MGKTDTYLTITLEEYEELLRAEFERDAIIAALKRSLDDRYGLTFDRDELVPVLSALGYNVHAWMADKVNGTEDAEE